jgi:mannan endo-1,4-beta-mannosidase
MHSNLFKKTSAAVMSAALALNGMAASAVTSFTTVAADTAKFEFEDAEVTGKTAVDSDADASGGSIIYMKDNGTIEMSFDVAAAGMYDLTIYAHGVGGSKQQDLKVNGASIGSLSIPEGDTYKPIKSSVKLAEGKNTITIVSSWGWTMFDYFTVESAVLPDIKASQTTPCDQLATKEAQSLLAYLNSVYGKNILSGQQEIYSSGHGGNFEQEFDYLKETTGKLPAVRGFDFLNEANILYGSEDKTTDRIIDWVNNKNGVATASWHLTVPKNFASYNVGDKIDWGSATYSCEWDSGKTKNTATDFNTANVLVEGTKENEYYMACLKELATYLKKIQDENVPLIFRPLHEAEGGGDETGSWFWWGASGSAVYKDIWKLTYKTLTEDYGIHNLIWEWNSYNFDTSADWYPGDEYVDIIGYDKYSCVKYLAENNWQASYVHDAGSYSSTFYGIMEKYDSKKMVALAENDSFSTVKDLTEDKAGWLYFCTWYDGGGKTDFLSDPIFNTKEDTIEMYNSDYCITLDELPADLYKNGKEVDPATTTTKAPVVTTTTASSDPAVTTTTTTAAFSFKVLKKAVTLPSGPKKTLTVTIDGAPTASIGGAFGFSNGPTPEDWVNIEWSGNADADGKLVVDIDISEVPDGVTSGEVQVWWSNVWDSAKKKGIDQPCEIGAYTVDAAAAETTTKAPAATTTTTTTAAPTTTTTTTNKPQVGDVTLIGDANLDEKVTVADAVAILQSIGNKDKYALKTQGAINADCCDPGDGVTARDALSIQKLDAGAIKELPEFTTKA